MTEPNDARYVIARTIGNMPEDDLDGPTHDEYADAVISALKSAGLSITPIPNACPYCGDYLDDGCPIHGSESEESPSGWEYNVRGHNSTDLMLNTWVDEDEARGWLDPRFNRVVVRRQKAGPVKVVP